MTKEALAVFDHFGFRYAGAPEPAVTDIDIVIRAGEFIILAGPSGCGKSTLLRSLIGLVPHMYKGDVTGSVSVCGMDVGKTPIPVLAKSVGLVFQNPENQIFMFSAERDIGFGPENLGLPPPEIRERVPWAMDLLGIRELAHLAPHQLSDGQKQRVAIAGVLAMKPRLLILDEPTSLLDPATASELVSAVQGLWRALGITVMIVEHRLDLLADAANRIIIMDRGRVVADGPPRQVLWESDLTALGLQVPLKALLHRSRPAHGALDGIDVGRTVRGQGAAKDD